MEFHHNLPIKDMFLLSSLPNVTYGIPGYDFPKKYFDLKKIKSNSAKKRPQSFQNKKLKNSSPAPNQYKLPSLWSEKKKGKSFSKNVKKNTFIDLIFRENERFNKPGPGQYFKNNNQEKKVKAIKKKEG